MFAGSFLVCIRYGRFGGESILLEPSDVGADDDDEDEEPDDEELDDELDDEDDDENVGVGSYELLPRPGAPPKVPPPPIDCCILTNGGTGARSPAVTIGVTAG